MLGLLLEASGVGSSVGASDGFTDFTLLGLSLGMPLEGSCVGPPLCNVESESNSVALGPPLGMLLDVNDVCF